MLIYVCICIGKEDERVGSPSNQKRSKESDSKEVRKKKRKTAT